MHPITRTLLIAFLAFTIPMSVAAYKNREALRPYVIGDAHTAEGHLLYFTRRG